MTKAIFIQYTSKAGKLVSYWRTVKNSVRFHSVAMTPYTVNGRDAMVTFADSQKAHELQCKEASLRFQAEHAQRMARVANDPNRARRIKQAADEKLYGPSRLSREYPVWKDAQLGF